MLVAVAVLLAVGVLFVRSATVWQSLPLGRQPWFRHLFYGGVGLAIGAALTRVHYRRLAALSLPLYGISLALLVAVLFAGRVVGGATRWLALGGLTVQPAEFAKLATLIRLADLLSRPRLPGRWRQTAREIGLTVALPVLLIQAEPSFSNAACLLAAATAMVVLARVPTRLVATLTVAGGLAAGGVGLVVSAPGAVGLTEAGCYRQLTEGIVSLRPYQARRIVAWLFPEGTFRAESWTRRQAETAVAAGGSLGLGYARGESKNLGFIPRPVASTDFILAVIGEEMGMLGLGLVLAASTALALCLLRIAAGCGDDFGRLLVAGIAVLLFLHAAINAAVVLGLTPVTGLPLPLVSSGGSFLICTLAAVGLAFGVHRHAAGGPTMPKGHAPPQPCQKQPTTEETLRAAWRWLEFSCVASFSHPPEAGLTVSVGRLHCGLPPARRTPHATPARRRLRRVPQGAPPSGPPRLSALLRACRQRRIHRGPHRHPL